MSIPRSRGRSCSRCRSCRPAGSPGSRPRCAVPPGPSTPSSIWRTAAAVAPEMIRRPRGWGSGRPPIALDDVGRPEDPAVGDGGVGGDHLHRRDELALADRQVAHRGARVLLQRQHQAPFFAGEPGPGGRAEAEAVDPVVEARSALDFADLDRADVARARQDFADRERFLGVFGVVVDGPVGDLDLVGHGEAAVGGDEALLQRAGDGDDLEGRARFVVEAHGAVLERAGRRRSPGSRR